MLAFFFLVPLLGLSVLAQNYSREELEHRYPNYGTNWVPMGVDENGELIVGYLTGDSRFSFSPEPSDVVTFTLFTRENPNGVKVGNISDVPAFDKTKPIKFVTHGWMSKGTADSCVRIKDGFLQKYDANVFIMDWGGISGNVLYPIPMAATKSVGEYYSKFLNELLLHGINPDRIHLVGHSLGAHVSGFAARGVNAGKIGRVTGLDPALPGFDSPRLVEGHLDKTDADFVDVIHTCAGYLGMKTSIGHADFYPNGGSLPQPGCGSFFEMIEACSHGRSWVFFAESLVSKVPFMAYRCDSFKNFVQKDECKDEGIPMGDPVPVTARGNYYLRTEDKAPFAVMDFTKDFDNFLR